MASIQAFMREGSIDWVVALMGVGSKRRVVSISGVVPRTWVGLFGREASRRRVLSLRVLVQAQGRVPFCSKVGFRSSWIGSFRWVHPR